MNATDRLALIAAALIVSGQPPEKVPLQALLLSNNLSDLPLLPPDQWPEVERRLAPEFARTPQSGAT